QDRHGATSLRRPRRLPYGLHAWVQVAGRSTRRARHRRRSAAFPPVQSSLRNLLFAFRFGCTTDFPFRFRRIDAERLEEIDAELAIAFQREDKKLASLDNVFGFQFIKTVDWCRIVKNGERRGFQAPAPGLSGLILLIASRIVCE